MEPKQLTSFFGWCSLINGTILILMTLVYMAAPDLVFRTQTSFFPITQEAFTIVFYCFLALFKALWLIFNVIPWVALIVMAKRARIA